MTGIELRARRRRLPGHRDPDAPRSQPELAEDLGYKPNTLAMLERGDVPLGKRGRILHLALRTLERDAGLVEWHDLDPHARGAATQKAKRDLETSARDFGGTPRRPVKRGAKKVRGGK